MDNFFNTNKNSNTNENIFTLESQHDSLKDNYKDIFIMAANSIKKEVEKFKPENPCVNCAIKDCKVTVKDVFTDYPVGCEYNKWQKQILSYLNGEFLKKLDATYDLIVESKSKYNCISCGNCCKLAVSEYSYDQLKQRASRGDNVSKDFISVFVPYESEDAAKSVNPEYFELLNALMSDQRIYYYYCPKLKDNLCSDYENRPAVCKNFPTNPLKLLPSTCSYNKWKEEVAVQAMLLRAKSDIIEFYKAKLS